MLRIKLVKSPIGHTRKNRATVLALGLRKVNQTVDHADHPSIRGMIHKVKNLLQVEEIEGDAPAAKPAPAKPAKQSTAKQPKQEAPKAEPKPKPKAAPKKKAADIAPEEPVEAGAEDQPPTEPAKEEEPK